MHLLAGYKYLAFHDLKAPNIDLEIATMPMASDENSPPPRPVTNGKEHCSLAQGRDRTFILLVHNISDSDFDRLAVGQIRSYTMADILGGLSIPCAQSML